jgi:hypothetical protein
MTRQDIEEHFQNKEKLPELLEQYQEVFDVILYWESCLKNDAVDTPSETDKAMKQLASVYSTLNVVARIAETYKINAESKYYNVKRMELENEGHKTVAASLENEATEHVSDYRRIRNIFEGYRDSCDRLISVLQSSLKSAEREKGFAHEN